MHAVALARSLGMIVDIGLLAISFSMQLLPATVDCLWVRRGTRLGVSLGILAGHLVTILAWRLKFAHVMDGVWGLLANVVVLALVSRAGSPPPRAARYEETLRS